jgi:hypothetical protein
VPKWPLSVSRPWPEHAYIAALPRERERERRERERERERERKYRL